MREKLKIALDKSLSLSYYSFCVARRVTRVEQLVARRAP